MEKYGFVYIWYDKYHKRYYIGSHWGLENDGYVCSSTWMRDAYRHRPQDFKRRILERVYTDRIELYERENYWLSLIKPEEIKDRKNPKYYNIHLNIHHWQLDENKALSVREKISKTLKKYYKENPDKKPIPPSPKDRICSDETKKKISKQKLGNEYVKGIKWFINELEEKIYTKDINNIPEGFKRGRKLYTVKYQKVDDDIRLKKENERTEKQKEASKKHSLKMKGRVAWNKGKSKKEFPKLSNSGRKKK